MNFDFLRHYGTPHEGDIPHSGRYPHGTGAKYDKKPGEWVKIALDREKEVRDNYDAIVNDPENQKKYRIKPGDSVEVVSAKMFGMSSGDYRAYKAIRKQEQKLIDIRKAVAMQNDNKSIADISRELDIPWSTVKTYLKPGAMDSASKTRNIANELLKELEKRKYLDVGEGVERQLNISENQLKAALMMLTDDGYNLYTDIHVRQPTNPDFKTTVSVLTNPDVTKDEVWKNHEQISSPKGVYFEDYGSVLCSREPLLCIDPDRIKVVYAEDGGAAKDGVIEIRPGLDDLTLGDRTYAQVRIGVNGTHYLKGMAVYGYDMPPGVDILFNTNKHVGTPALGEDKNNTVLKHLKTDDSGNPFGTNTRQWEYIGADGMKHRSAIEIVNDDTDWTKWKKSLPSQLLSKQPIGLAIKQLNQAYKEKEEELEEILKIENPTVRNMMLYDFSEACDRSAVDLKAAALPRQSTKAILPVLSLKDDEAYAPGYDQGEKLYLFRFPHAGTFEIAEVRVNNENEEAKKVLGTHPAHAIGINSNVANRLSGADFDGDTVLIIPGKGVNIQTMPPLEELKDFDPKELYRKSPDQKKTGDGDGFVKGRHMGDITNLITDMTMIAASKSRAGNDISEEEISEIARAVRHSMVVIDAEKHNLDWKQSYLDNNIAELKKKYQGSVRAGGATLISRAKGQGHIDEIEENTKPSTMTAEELERWKKGEKIYFETGRTYEKNGKTVKAQTEKEKMAIALMTTHDAHTLSSGYLMDEVYADHANKLYELGNKARSIERNTPDAKVNPEAKVAYKDEVASIYAKLNEAALNAPRERQAVLIADKNVTLRIKAEPWLANKKDKEAVDKLKKIRAREMESARALTNAKRHPIDLTKKEWEAIEARAIPSSTVKKVLRYSDSKKIKEYTSTKNKPALNDAKLARARTLLSMGGNSGWTPSTVAEELGVSVSTLTKALDNFNGRMGGA